MKNTIIIILLPFVVLSQEVLIRQLSDNINTNNAEINFLQINDSTAYFTVVSDVEDKLESNIYVATFINGNWGKKHYTKYNSDLFNLSNISSFESGRTFFTICNNEMLDCKIVYLEKNTKQGFYEIPALSSDQFFNTQPFISKHDSQKVLYFVSDRKGGFGGLDIWLSIVDKDGKFGIPINAGSKINSSYDEITPFYNNHDGKMYFSSNKEDGFGGFDIYNTEGKLNLWGEAKNMEELNTIQDDLYLIFYDKNSGYFSSNRKGAKFQSSEYCCNDIFSFQYSKAPLNTTIAPSKINEYFPLDLYFHNDEPDSRTINTITNKTYKEAYISYFMLKANYEKQNLNLNNFFDDILQKNFNTLNKVLDILLFDLSNGNHMELQVRGYASPLHHAYYNQNLSQRRISSLINYLVQFRNGLLKEYIDSEKLTITELSFGESNASDMVSDEAHDKKKSIYSIGAMLERKIEIVDIILKQ